MSDKNQFKNIGDGLLVRAPAKMNLSLFVSGKRPWKSSIINSAFSETSPNGGQKS
jgi:hypothetical protein